MKLTKIQYKKLEELMSIARKMVKISNYKFTLYDGKWLQMNGIG